MGFLSGIEKGAEAVGRAIEGEAKKLLTPSALCQIAEELARLLEGKPLDMGSAEKALADGLIGILRHLAG